MGPRKKTFLISGILVIISMALIYFGVYFLFEEIKKNSEELIKTKKELILLEIRFKDFEQFKKISGALQPDIEGSEKLFINPEVPIDFVQFLEKTALDSGVSIGISLPSAAVKKGEPWSFLEFQINVTGLFPEFLKFLEKIENAPYLIEIKNLSINRISEKDITRKEFTTSTPADVSSILSIKVFVK